MGKTTLILLLLLSIGLLAPAGLYAQWIQNGIPISAETYDQINPKAVSDGAGGAIFTWRDNRSTSPGMGVYVQRVDGWGNILWTVNGTPLQNTYVYDPEIASDGAGGAIVVWTGKVGGSWDLYAQRIDASGTGQWQSGGVLISNRTSIQDNYKVIADGAGGAIIAWQDSTLDAMTPSADIFAQKIDANGSTQWTANGVAVCTNMFQQYEPCIATDGDGGAIIAWDDRRGGPADIYAQSISASGAAVWTANGKIICNAVNSQQSQCITSDGWGGAIIGWTDYRGGTIPLLYAQRIARTGGISWTANGILVGTINDHMYYPVVVSDGSNGAIFAWAQRVGGSQDIYAQRISYLGTREWNSTGNPVCSATGVQSSPAAVEDGAGGAVIAWQDSRSGTLRDIYAQKMSHDGMPQWLTNGVAACVEGTDQVRACIASDDIGGAVIGWEDYRTTRSDVYAQRIERFGNWGYPSPVITSVQDKPDDQGGWVTVAWDKSRLETFIAPVISQYSLWRMLPEEELQSLLEKGDKGVDPAALFTSRDGSAPLVTLLADGQPPQDAVPAGIYYISSSAGTTAGWEFITYVDATNSDTYSAYVPTLFDSTASDPGLHYFMVMAHGTQQFTFWESEPCGGCSVDNVAPAQPGSFSGEQSYDPDGLYLHWGAGGLAGPMSDDFSHYALYRSALPDIEPGPANIIYEGADAEYFDDDWRWDNPFYYLVSAVDIHGNESGFAYLGPEEITGDETPGTPSASYLAQNAPNPFNPSTVISFGLTARGRVTLSIYDVTGRLVRVLIDEDRDAGHYRESWDGRGAHGSTVASGVYFYRLRAGTFSETRKMVLTR